MITLSSNLKQRCRAAQLRCYQFNSYGTLHPVFNVEGISDYKDQLPQAIPYSATAQVDLTMNFLLEKDTHNGQLVFLIFLGELRNSVPKPEALHQELGECCKLVEQEYQLHQVKCDLDERRLAMHGCRNEPRNIVDLIHHFLKCPHMSNKEQREAVVNRLPVEIARKVANNEQDSDFADMLHILKACSQHPNGVEQLAYALYEFENESYEWQALDKFLRYLFNTNVTYTRLKQLLSILREITWPEDVLKDVLRKAYNASMPERCELPDATDGIVLLWLMLDKLAKERQIDAIVKFVEYLAYEVDKRKKQDIRDALRTWSARRADELGMGDFLEKLRQDVQSYAPPSAAYLLIAVDTEDQRTFEIQAWLLNSKNKPVEKTEAFISNESVTEKDISRCIDEIRRQYAEYLSEDLIVEIFLPRKLLSCAVDHWLINVGMRKAKLGHRHKVVVRSLERAQDRLMWAVWERKWNKFQKFKQGEKLDEISVKLKGPLWICKEEECQEEELFDVALSASHVICLALEFVPAADVFDTVLSAGIPIALWSRQQTNHSTPIYDLFKTLLLLDDLSPCPKKLSTLRRSVWEERLEAVLSPNEHPYGHSLTLLWDSPYRLPPGSPVKLLKYPS